MGVSNGKVELCEIDQFQARMSMSNAQTIAKQILNTITNSTIWTTSCSHGSYYKDWYLKNQLQIRSPSNITTNFSRNNI